MNRRVIHRFSPRNHGTSMLFITGISMVLWLAVFGTYEGTIRSYLKAETNRQQAQAHWIALGGAEWARSHAAEIGQNQSAVKLGDGAFTCRLAKGENGAEQIVIHARVPDVRARATDTIRIAK